MKKLLLTLAILLATLVNVTAKEVPQEEPVNYSNMESLTVSGNIDIVLKVTTDAEAVGQLYSEQEFEIKEKKGKVYIASLKKNPAKITINVGEKVSYIELKSGAICTIEQGVRFNNLKIVASGRSVLKGEVDCNKLLNVEADSSSSIEIKGICNTLDTKSSKKSIIDLENLQCNSITSIVLRNNAVIKVKASKIGSLTKDANSTLNINGQTL